MWAWVPLLHECSLLNLGKGEKATQGKGDPGKSPHHGDERSAKEQACPTAHAHFRPLLVSHLLTSHWSNWKARERKVHSAFCGRHCRDTQQRVWMQKGVKDWDNNAICFLQRNERSIYTSNLDLEDLAKRCWLLSDGSCSHAFLPSIGELSSIPHIDHGNELALWYCLRKGMTRGQDTSQGLL